ncbi:hypothetical protein BCON_0064g00200 [Botryotinia convoluta]|uniref:Cytochrome P450 n=1 Tax=Botryotinia convoluta TaxID=54673 RepID=A0A4Z1ID93_9HELO|nr:hypothetical protein BCON_0064g00200 [Botryotinia convoluta]
MRPTFTRTNVANLPAFEKNLQKFFKLLPEDGSTVDLKPLLCKLLGKLAFLYRDKKYYDSIKVAHAFADFYVDKAIEYRTERLSKEQSAEKDRSGHKYVLLHDMAMQTGNRNELRSQILHVFLAGHESSAITIGNAVFQLSRNPSVWEKLRQEVIEVHGTSVSSFTHDRLKNLKYLQNVIKETLRLYPVASIASRKAYKNGVLPRGGGSDGAAYIPFGWGIRTCPAQHLAEIEIAYTLASMAQKWKYLECRDEVEEWVEELRVSTSSRNGVKVALVAE